MCIVTHEELVKRAGLAIGRLDCCLCKSCCESCSGSARAAIAEVRAVLEEPSEAMLEASNREWDGRMSYRSTGAFLAMLSASPLVEDKQ